MQISLRLRFRIRSASDASSPKDARCREFVTHRRASGGRDWRTRRGWRFWRAAYRSSSQAVQRARDESRNVLMKRSGEGVNETAGCKGGTIAGTRPAPEARFLPRSPGMLLKRLPTEPVNVASSPIATQRDGETNAAHIQKAILKPYTGTFNKRAKNSRSKSYFCVRMDNNLTLIVRISRSVSTYCDCHRKCIHDFEFRICQKHIIYQKYAVFCHHHDEVSLLCASSCAACLANPFLNRWTWNRWLAVRWPRTGRVRE